LVVSQQEKRVFEQKKRTAGDLARTNHLFSLDDAHRLMSKDALLPSSAGNCRKGGGPIRQVEVIYRHVVVGTEGLIRTVYTHVIFAGQQSALIGDCFLCLSWRLPILVSARRPAGLLSFSARDGISMPGRDFDAPFEEGISRIRFIKSTANEFLLIGTLLDVVNAGSRYLAPGLVPVVPGMFFLTGFSITLGLYRLFSPRISGALEWAFHADLRRCCV
jgi:hypothetical protein